jgi:prophage maintenance system killer protein
MNQITFQIMYNALVEIASSEAFFNGEKRLAAIAMKALQEIAHIPESDRTK